MSDFERGQWYAADKLMQWLNEQEDNILRKTDVYAWAMALRPDKDNDKT